MIEILDTELAKTIVAFLLFTSIVILWIIFHQGSAEDNETRHYYGIDKYILPFLAIVAIPHIYIAWIMFQNGFILLYIFNLVGVCLLWYMGNHYVIGGADAICWIFVALCFPFVIPVVVLSLTTLIIEKIMRWKSPSIDSDWSVGKVPLLIPGYYGYLCTIPISILFLIFVII